MPCLNPDVVAGATLGPFKSRVAGIGPQLGYLFPLNEAYSGHLNGKVYWEFAAQNRPEGWNAWLIVCDIAGAAQARTASSRGHAVRSEVTHQRPILIN